MFYAAHTCEVLCAFRFFFLFFLLSDDALASRLPPRIGAKNNNGHVKYKLEDVWIELTFERIVTTGNRVFASSFIETIHQLWHHIEGADSLSAWIVSSMSLLIVNQCWIFNARAFSSAFEVSSILFAGLGTFPAANSSLTTVANIMFVKQDVVNVALRNDLHQRVV